MDYSLILSELRQASTFDLFRLQSAIGRLLDDPARLTAIKRELRPGMEITYFQPRENRLVPARVLGVRNTRAAVEDLETAKRWTIPLYAINLRANDTDIAPEKRQVDRLSLRVGDTVGFTGQGGQELFGTVARLNPKRAKIETDRGTWAVPYPLLFTVIDGERGTELTIPDHST